MAVPPKARITKEMILDTILNITRESGFEAVNARSIANKLQCSTRPIFTCFENMEELKAAFLAFAYEYYSRYVSDFGRAADVSPYLLHPLAYTAFAQRETNLFRLLFIDDMDLAMADPEDFYQEIGNEERAVLFSKAIGIKPEHARGIFFDLFLYTHGIAVLIAGGKLTLEQSKTQEMLENILSAFVKQEKSGCKVSFD